ncbi:MAG: phosphotransferase family protein [Halobacteriaceae archaeon]
MTVELSPATAGPYLRERGVVAPDADVEAETLGGGVSNRVVRATARERRLVLKQPLPNLDVADDWPADVERVHNEAAAARAWGDALSDVDGARVPAVAFEDRDAHVVGFECAPADATPWKADLLAGRVDRTVAETAGRALAAVHRAAAGDADLRSSFGDRRPFEQLRLDPYHETTARRHPEVAEAIRTEAERVRSVERTLVHGDYSPKNLLVGADVWILDFEVAHWGDPAFDAAFMCNHLLIESVYNRERQAAYLDALDAFYAAYDAGVPWSVEAETAAELAVLLLARVDGKSPVEYVGEGSTAEALRRIAVRALREGPDTLDGVTALAREEVPAT